MARKVVKKVKPAVAKDKGEVNWQTELQMVCTSCESEVTMTAQQIKEKMKVCEQCEKRCKTLSCSKCHGEDAMLLPAAIKHFNDWSHGKCVTPPKDKDLKRARLVLTLVYSGA